MTDPRVIAVTDCGSTTTKALLFENENGHWRLKARTDSPTTVEPPAGDVLVGVTNALFSAGRIAGRRIVDENGCIIRPAAENEGVDLFLSTSSAGGGLQVAVAGAVREFSVKSAQRAALGAGAIISGTLSLNEIDAGPDAVDFLRQIEPDIVLLAGGVDGGGERQVLELAALLASSGIRPRYGSGRLPLIYAGNAEVRQKVESLLDDQFALSISQNVLPDLETGNLDAAREMIHEVFLDHVMSSAPGLSGLKERVDADVVPTPAAVSRLLEMVGKEMNTDVIAVDIGGATTDIFSWKDSALNRTVSANLGMSYSAYNVLEETGIENILRWLAVDEKEGDVLDVLMNKAARPTTIPADMRDLVIEQAVAREALRLSYQHHRSLTGQDESRAASSIGLGSFSGAEDENLCTCGLIIGSGGVLSHAPSDAQAALMILDSFQPAFHTTIAKDSVFMMPHLGILSKILPEAALDLFHTECLSIIADTFSPAGRIAAGRPCMKYTFTSAAAPSIEKEGIGGEITRLEFNPGEKVGLMVKPYRGVDAGAGAGKEVEMELTAGSEGVIVDTRARPLIMPAGENARETLFSWAQSLGAFREASP